MTLLLQIHTDVDDDDEGPAIRGPFRHTATHTTRTEDFRRLSGGPLVTFHLLLPYFSVTVDDVSIFFSPLFSVVSLKKEKEKNSLAILPFSSSPGSPYPFCIHYLEKLPQKNLLFINKPRRSTPHQTEKEGNERRPEKINTVIHQVVDTD